MTTPFAWKSTYPVVCGLATLISAAACSGKVGSMGGLGGVAEQGGRAGQSAKGGASSAGSANAQGGSGEGGVSADAGAAGESDPGASAGQAGDDGNGQGGSVGGAGGSSGRAGASGSAGSAAGFGGSGASGGSGGNVDSTAGADGSGGSSAGHGGAAGVGQGGAGGVGVGGSAGQSGGLTGRIIVGATGVAFSASPARSVLKRNVIVYSSAGRTDIDWSATTDQPWLTVSPSGKTGQTVTLSANPTALAAGKTHFATVYVKSSDSTIENQEAIRVGLHVLEHAARDLSLTLGGLFLATSSVEPLAFIADGGTDIAAYNVFSGERVRVLAQVVANAGALTLSGDGRTLFVFDRNNLRVQEVDASTGALVQSFPSPGATGSGLLSFRPNAYPTLVVPSSALYDVPSGQPLANASLSGGYSLMASADGAIVVNESGTVYTVARSGSNGSSTLVKMLFNAGTAQGRVGQACLSADRSTVYTASGAPYHFPGVSFSTHQTVQILPGSNYPNSILCAWNNLIIGGIDGYYNANDIWVYDGPSGIELAKLSSAVATSYRSLVDRGLAISGDGSRLVALSLSTPGSNSAKEIRFQSLPAPK